MREWREREGKGGREKEREGGKEGGRKGGRERGREEEKRKRRGREGGRDEGRQSWEREEVSEYLAIHTVIYTHTKHAWAFPSLVFDHWRLHSLGTRLHYPNTRITFTNTIKCVAKVTSYILLSQRQSNLLPR